MLTALWLLIGPGLRHANIIQTGDDRYCIIAEWNSAEDIVAARPQMIETLNSSATLLMIWEADWA